MSRRVWQVVGAVAIAGMFQLPTAAQDVGEYTAYDDVSTDQIGEIEAELIARRRTLDDGIEGDGYADGYADGCCGGCGECCQACCCRTSWYAGADLVWVEPHMNYHHAWVASNGGLATVRTFDADPELTARLYLGYKDCDGFGGRVRYWEYDHVVDQRAADVPAGTAILATVGSGAAQLQLAGLADTASVAASFGMEMEVWDFELTQDLNWCCNTVTLFGGIRFARTQQVYGVVAFNQTLANLGPNTLLTALAQAHSFNGYGPTAGFDLSHPIGCNGLGVYFGLRESVLFGEQQRAVISFFDDDGEVAPGPGLVKVDAEVVRAVTEVQLGVEYKRWVNCTSYIFARAGWEGQMWHQAGGPNGIDNDLGLMGYTLSCGVMR